MTETPSEFERSFEPGEFYLGKGVGPHPLPWPESSDFAEQLLAEGDRRNITDEYRYLTVEAIRRRLSQSRIPLEVAIENWQHDLNIGSLVRTANAFNLNAVHIVGKKHWNQHGALMTDKYLDIHHHADAQSLRAHADETGRAIIGIENGVEAVPLHQVSLPKNAILLLGNEGLGLSEESLSFCDQVVEIPQWGSVRSMNASVAGGIVIFEWIRQHQLVEE
jgi:tRNA G18 (ribose-2'-O)-methylase SpoU